MKALFQDVFWWHILKLKENKTKEVVTYDLCLPFQKVIK